MIRFSTTLCLFAFLAGLCTANAQSGCTIPTACNYDPAAAVNDGTCSWTVDCAGVCGGLNILDACGNCYEPGGEPGQEVFDYTGSIVTWTVPEDVTTITVEAFGAEGGGAGGDGQSLAGGLGARMAGTFDVTPGQQFQILVGEMGYTGVNAAECFERNNNGGGGGTFFVRSDNTPYLIAGGGGGGPSNFEDFSCPRDQNVAHGQITEDGNDSQNCSGVGQGGTNGNGGLAAGNYHGGSGGGFFTDGVNGQYKCSGVPERGRAFVNGGAGGWSPTSANGGFGGGGAGNRGGPGGGGGYSGGGVSAAWSSGATYGGGGGSFADPNAMDTSGEAGFQSGNGQLIITYNTIPECFPGCTDPIALNYDATATTDDGSCEYNEGCTDPAACNYTPNVVLDNPSLCLYLDCAGTCGGDWITDACGTCYDPNGKTPVCIFGCTDPAAENYEPNATADDGSCVLFFGCTDPTACNFESGALNDDGSCLYSDCQGTCGGDYVIDDCGNCIDAAVLAGSKQFTYTGTIEEWVIPDGVTSILMDVRGAQGGSCVFNGGRGARVLTTVTVVPGQVLKILVGGQGASTCIASGGGGGSFVALSDDTPIAVAGGGSGATQFVSGNPGTDSVNGDAGDGCPGNGGVNGAGGGDASGCGDGAGGGGGFYSDGASTSTFGGMRGQGFVNGGAGGISTSGGADGGFGGGAATEANNTGGGAGGGYSGGGAPSPNNDDSGGGGGSYATGTLLIPIQDGVWQGDGLVTFTFSADDPCLFGCTDPLADNFNAAATGDDGSCLYSGCTDSEACNFNPLATVDDASCLYTADCFGNCNGNGILDACGNCYDPTADAVVKLLTTTDYIQLVEISEFVGQVRIEAAGAQGGGFSGTSGGLGAVLSGTFDVVPGDILQVAVGAQGDPGDGAFNYAGGGGGTFVLDGAGNPLIVAGGGGGIAGASANGNENATAGIFGNDGYSPDYPQDYGLGGINGNGATNPNGGFACGGNGAGLYSDGVAGVCIGTAPVNGAGIVNGGFGGISACGPGIRGGFGGGGGGGCHGAGGGGGYAGGGGSTGPDGNGGGGSCYNAGIDPTITQIVNTGDGFVRITFLTEPYCSLGCTDQAALNFDPSAIADDGTCQIPGCQDDTAANYNANATVGDGSCLFPGCTYPDALNFNAGANAEDGSCAFENCAGLTGCTDPTACNYNEYATIDTGNCQFVDSCGDCGGFGTSGCTYLSACNYDPDATCDDGSCDFSSCVGCIYPEATNYDPEATIDNGFCLFENPEELCGEGTFYDPILMECTTLPLSCPTDLDFDGQTGTNDLLILLAFFSTDCP